MGFKLEGMTIAVVNMTNMVKFYSAVFDIQFEEKEMYGSKLYQGKWLDLNLLFCPAEIARNTSKQNRHQFEILVPHLHSTLEKCKSSGGKLIGAIVEDETTLSVGIYDPDQNSIVLKQHKQT